MTAGSGPGRPLGAVRPARCPGRRRRRRRLLRRNVRVARHRPPPVRASLGPPDEPGRRRRPQPRHRGRAGRGHRLPRRRHRARARPRPGAPGIALDGGPDRGHRPPGGAAGSPSPVGGLAPDHARAALPGHGHRYGCADLSRLLDGQRIPPSPSRARYRRLRPVLPHRRGRRARLPAHDDGRALPVQSGGHRRPRLRAVIRCLAPPVSRVGASRGGHPSPAGRGGASSAPRHGVARSPSPHPTRRSRLLRPALCEGAGAAPALGDHSARRSPVPDVPGVAGRVRLPGESPLLGRRRPGARPRRREPPWHPGADTAP